MALTHTVLHASTLVHIRHVACRPHSAECGEVECAQAHCLVLPLNGVFLKHLGREERVLADAQHALFFRAGRSYRVSHPARGGDDCLALDFSADTLREVISHIDPRAAERDEFFRMPSGRLSAPWILSKHRLASGLRSRQVGALEADEVALELLSACAPVSLISTPGTRRRRTDARRCERVEATRVTLATRSSETWSLPDLARRVHCSPWHLARQFRASTGMPLHRFQLMARLTSALERILDTRDDLARIAADLGFSTHSHFTASFRRAFGCTPVQVRGGACRTA